MEFFETMKKRGVVPDAVTYSSLIKAFERTGQLQRALAIRAEQRQQNEGGRKDRQGERQRERRGKDGVAGRVKEAKEENTGEAGEEKGKQKKPNPQAWAWLDDIDLDRTD